MPTVTTKAVRAALDKAGVSSDQIRTRDGRVEVKRSYFYRFNDSAEKFAERVAGGLASQGLKVAAVTSEDRWAAWPKTSYFVAIVEA